MLDLSCTDWRDRLRAGRSLVPDLTLPDPAAGDRAVAVFNRLRPADVPHPDHGEAGGEWFRDIVRALFGAYDAEAKQRPIRELFLLVPKKNSKTTNGALLMLTALLLNERPKAPFLLTAPVQKTAEEAFRHRRRGGAGSGARGEAARPRPSEADRAPADEGAARGDDLRPGHHHRSQGGRGADRRAPRLGKMPRAAKAMVQLRGGMAPFPEAFLATITTQSDEPRSGVRR